MPVRLLRTEFKRVTKWSPKAFAQKVDPTSDKYTCYTVMGRPGTDPVFGIRHGQTRHGKKWARHGPTQHGKKIPRKLGGPICQFLEK